MSPLLVKTLINFAKARAVAKAAGVEPANIGHGIGMVFGLLIVIVLASICQHQGGRVHAVVPCGVDGELFNVDGDAGATLFLLLPRSSPLFLFIITISLPFVSASSLTYSFPLDYLFILFRSLNLPEPERRRAESRTRTGQRLARGHPRRGDTQFKDRTLICIAHRLRTIISYDRILVGACKVLDAGKIAEFDTPLTLFNRNESLFRSLCDKSNITSGDIEKAITSDDETSTKDLTAEGVGFFDLQESDPTSSLELG
ncbi:hypothetical protein B0H13DRAFT_1919155 [Mycena leptocephala]|nr:hypothetical protein B0H13DRAFT_1919155 [Mycena leptocephala]